MGLLIAPIRLCSRWCDGGGANRPLVFQEIVHQAGLIGA